MRRCFVAVVMAALAATASPVGAAERLDHGPDWTASGHVGVSLGSQTDPSFAWRAGVHRWISPGGSLGIEVGRYRWEGSEGTGFSVPLSPFEPFRGLEKGGNELQHASLAARMHAEGVGPHLSAPLLALGVGVYRQVVRSSSRDSRHDKYCVGVSFALGGAATRGLAPGAELRFEFVDTEPGPTHYFTISAALLGNR